MAKQDRSPQKSDETPRDGGDGVRVGRRRKQRRDALERNYELAVKRTQQEEAQKPLRNDLELPSVIIDEAAIRNYLERDFGGARLQEFRGLAEKVVVSTGIREADQKPYAVHVAEQLLPSGNLEERPVAVIGQQFYLVLELEDSPLKGNPEQRLALVTPVKVGNALQVKSVIFTDRQGLFGMQQDNRVTLVDRSMAAKDMPRPGQHKK